MKTLNQNKLIITFVIFAIIMFSWWLMAHTFQSRHHQLLIASTVWSDFAAHIPLIRSFSYGHNFPPEYPTFPGEPIKYHYLMYALVGGLESMGLDIALALNLVSAAGFALLLGMIFLTTKTIFKNTTAGILALILFIFNGSLSFIEFFNTYPLSIHTLSDIVNATHFASFGPWDHKMVSAFWNLNIYTNQRHLGWGFGLLLLILWPIINHLFSKSHLSVKTIISSSLIMLILPLIHQAAFAAAIVIIASLFMLFLFSKPIRIYCLAVLAAAVPGIIYTFLQQSDHRIVFQLGFLSQTPHFTDISFYWIFNLGLYILIVPLLFIQLKTNEKKVLLSFVPLFILSNLFRFTPDMINNHKFINIFMIGVVIYTAGWLISIWNKKTIFKPVVIILTVALTFSGFIDFFPILNDHYLTLDDIPQSDTASWIVQNTPPQSVFLTTTYLYNPASLAGRKTWLDYGYFNWSLGYNDSVRKEQLPKLFSSSLGQDEICTLLTKNNIGYIYLDHGKGSLPSINPHESVISTQNSPVFTSLNDDKIFSVQQICQ